MATLGLFLWTWSILQTTWIGETPDFRFRPMDQNSKSQLIWFNRKAEMRNTYWGTELKKFIDQNYQYPTKGSAPISCRFGQEGATEHDACWLERSTMLNKACTWEEYEFGYGDGIGRPCVLIQLDKIYDWIPQSYETLEDLHLALQKGMPFYLVAKIKDMIERNPNDPELKTIWVTCQGVAPVDRENIGPLEYYSAGIVNNNGPRGNSKQFQGIPNYFFPYQNQDNYKAPFVFVKFTKPQSNIRIRVVCKAWAKNIDQVGGGSVHFELIID